jgi:hypothetical protein
VAPTTGTNCQAAPPIEPFVDQWLQEHGQASLDDQQRRTAARNVRNPIHQLLHLIIPGYQNNGRCHDLADPFTDSAPGFFAFLRRDRGCYAKLRLFSTNTIYVVWRTHKIEMKALSDLSPAVLSTFITDSGLTNGRYKACAAP